MPTDNLILEQHLSKSFEIGTIEHGTVFIRQYGGHERAKGQATLTLFDPALKSLEDLLLMNEVNVEL